MNFLKDWFYAVNLYISNKYIFLISLLTIFSIETTTILFKYYLPSKEYILILYDIFSSLILYTSMIALISIIYVIKSKKANFENRFFKAIEKSWWIIIVKLLWNYSSILIMGTEYLPEENLSIIPAIILFSSWIIILGSAFYIVPRSIFDSKSENSFSLFINYFFSKILKIIIFTFFSMITAFFVLFFCSFIISYIEPILNNFFNIQFKFFIEDILSTITQVIYAHLIATSAFILYSK
jgi:hypothetical protein